MKLVRTVSGYIAYSASREEPTILGGLGICDFCNKSASSGFLVPVLNDYLCPACFADWDSRAKYYPEDLAVEERNAKYYESRIALEGDESECPDPTFGSLLSTT